MQPRIRDRNHDFACMDAHGTDGELERCLSTLISAVVVESQQDIEGGGKKLWPTAGTLKLQKVNPIFCQINTLRPIPFELCQTRNPEHWNSPPPLSPLPPHPKTLKSLGPGCALVRVFASSQNPPKNRQARPSCWWLGEFRDAKPFEVGPPERHGL